MIREKGLSTIGKIGIIVIIILGVVGIIAGLAAPSEDIEDLTLIDPTGERYPAEESPTLTLSLENQTPLDSLIILEGSILAPTDETELYSIWYGPDGETIMDFGEINEVFDGDYWRELIELNPDLDPDEHDPEDIEFIVEWPVGPNPEDEELHHEWEEGTHEIEIILNNEVERTIEFEIQGE